VLLGFYICISNYVYDSCSNEIFFIVLYQTLVYIRKYVIEEDIFRNLDEFIKITRTYDICTISIGTLVFAALKRSKHGPQESASL